MHVSKTFSDRKVIRKSKCSSQRMCFWYKPKFSKLMHNKICNSQKGELLIISWEVKGSVYSPSKQEIVEQHSVQLHISLTRQPSAKRHSLILIFFTTNIDNPATMLHCCIVHYTPLQNNLNPLIEVVVNKEIIKDCRALTYRVQKETNLQGDDLGGRGVFLVGVCYPVLQILTLSQTKKGEAAHGVRISLSILFPGLGLSPRGGDIWLFLHQRCTNWHY